MSYFREPDKETVLEILEQLTEAVKEDRAKVISCSFSKALLGEHAIELGLEFRIEDPR